MVSWRHGNSNILPSSSATWSEVGVTLASTSCVRPTRGWVMRKDLDRSTQEQERVVTKLLRFFLNREYKHVLIRSSRRLPGPLALVLLLLVILSVALGVVSRFVDVPAFVRARWASYRTSSTIEADPQRLIDSTRAPAAPATQPPAESTVTAPSGRAGRQPTNKDNNISAQVHAAKRTEYEITILLPDYMQGADILVDGQFTAPTRRELTGLKILVEEKDGPHKITILKGDDTCTVFQLIRGDIRLEPFAR